MNTKFNLLIYFKRRRTITVKKTKKNDTVSKLKKDLIKSEHQKTLAFLIGNMTGDPTMFNSMTAASAGRLSAIEKIMNILEIEYDPYKHPNYRLFLDKTRMKMLDEYEIPTIKE